MACLTLLFSCGQKHETDSKEIADDQNAEKFDKSEGGMGANQAIEKDADFAVKVADGGMLEVRLGELAQSNASSPEVKRFGQHMITDHSKANEEQRMHCVWRARRPTRHHVGAPRRICAANAAAAKRRTSTGPLNAPPQKSPRRSTTSSAPAAVRCP